MTTIESHLPMITPFTKRFMRHTLGVLQSDVLGHIEAMETPGFKPARSGIQPAPKVSAKDGLGNVIEGYSIGTHLVARAELGLDVYRLNPENGDWVASIHVGNVVPQHPNGDHFNNRSGGDYFEARHETRAALARFVYDATMDHYND